MEQNDDHILHDMLFEHRQNFSNFDKIIGQFPNVVEARNYSWLNGKPYWWQLTADVKNFSSNEPDRDIQNHITPIGKPFI